MALLMPFSAFTGSRPVAMPADDDSSCKDSGENSTDGFSSSALAYDCDGYTVNRNRNGTAFPPTVWQFSAIPIRKARTIQLVPTPLNDEVQLSDADRDVRVIQLVRW